MDPRFSGLRGFLKPFGQLFADTMQSRFCRALGNTGDPRDFGETCQCDADCNEFFPTCLPSGRYCSIYGCTEDPTLCPEGIECQDVFGLFSFCKTPA